MKGTSPSRADREAATGIKAPRWEVRILINSLGRGSHGHCLRWSRSRQERLCAAWCERHGRGAVASAQGRAHQAARAGGRAVGVHDRHRGLLRRAPLGAAVRRPRPHYQADGAEAGDAVSDERQARQACPEPVEGSSASSCRKSPKSFVAKLHSTWRTGPATPTPSSATCLCNLWRNR